MLKEVPRIVSSPVDPVEGAPDASGGLAHEVQTLSDVIRDLEEQLDRMLSANEAMSQDLTEERQQRVALEGVIHDLENRLGQAQKKLADRDSLLAEINHLNQERGRLAAAHRDLTKRFEDSEQTRRKQIAQIERLRAAREDAVNEVQTVEAQFERAMQLVGEERARLAVVIEERDALSGRAKIAEKQLSRLQEERDALFAEVEQSREALDEIRRSLVDAVVVSSGAVKDEAEGERSRWGRGGS